MAVRGNPVLRGRPRLFLDPSAGSKYGVAGITALAALGVRLVLDPVLGTHSPYLPSTIAVIVAAQFGGRGPGFASTAIGALGIAFFLIEPRHSFLVASHQAAAGLALFAAVGLLISLVVGSRRESLLSTARAKDALRRKTQLVDLSHDAVVTADSNRRITGWNTGATEMYGWTESEALGQAIHTLLQTSIGISPAGIDEVLHREGRWGGELNHISRDGRRLVVESRQVLVRDDGNEPVGILQIDRDVTEHKQAQDELRGSEALFRTLANAIPQLCWMANADGWIFWYNQRWYEYTGATPEQMEGWGWQSVHDPSVLPEVLERWKGAIAAGEPFEMVFPLRAADGVLRPFLTRAIPVRDQDDKVSRWFGTNTDISEQRAQQEVFRQASEQRGLALAAANMGAWDYRFETRDVFWDERCRNMFGVPSGGQIDYDVAIARIHADDREATDEAVKQAIAGINGGAYYGEYRVVWPDGSVHWVASHGQAFFEGEGDQRRAVRFVGVNMDTTERKCAEHERERLTTKLEAVLDNIAEGVVIADGQGNLVSMNAAALAIHGYQSIEQVRRHSLEFKDTFELFDAAGRSLPMEESPMSRALRGETFSDFEVRVVRKDTGKSWTGSYSGVAARSQSGEAIHVVVLRDITERKRAEERLRQTQKLESIGLLAGGVAHDFNNLLTVIMGSASSALAECPACGHSQTVLSAAERASHLTKQLLAYAGKGRTVAKILDLTELVRQSTRLVSASVPKRVSLSFNLAENLPCLEADPSQIEQILMNFIINAGESIPPKSDGKIEISTGSCEVAPAIALVHSKEYDVAAGAYVWLEVRDDGGGMDEATRSRIFDPFFTTKFTGRGLGLAAIHGIVRTYRGFIDVRSSPGAGAAFRVFLPASEKTRATEPASRVPRQQHRGDSTILVVDDEEMVRRLACMVLRGHGYEVLEAKDGKDALEVLANCSALPSLALLDLAMPVMGGDELVPILEAKYPALKVVISSGYPEEEARKDSPSEAVAGFLQKPYAPVALIEKIGEVLGRRPANSGLIEFPRTG